MANNVINWALVQPCTPTEKLVLLLLANRAHKDGTGARPGLQLLTDESGLSMRSVQSALASLEVKGLIQALAYRKGGHGRATVWRCCLEAGVITKPEPKKGARAAPLLSVIVDGEEQLMDRDTGELTPKNSATPARLNSATDDNNSATLPPENSAAAAPQPKNLMNQGAIELLKQKLGAEVVAEIGS